MNILGSIVFVLIIVILGAFLLLGNWQKTPHGKLGLVEAILLNYYFKPINRFEVPAPIQRKLTQALRAKFPDPVVELPKIENQVVSGEGGEIPIRIYYPNTQKSLPAIVFFHGGGWVLGNLNSHDYVCSKLAIESNSIVVSADYRLAPEHKFPAAFDDCYAVTKWVAEQGGVLGIDTNRIAVGGDSAGGNLAAAVCLKARDEKEIDLAFQLLVYPVTDASNFDTKSHNDFKEGYLLSQQDMDYFRTAYARTEADYTNPYFSPLLAESHADLPPAFVLTAGFDPLRSEGEAYANKLKEAGVLVDYKNYERNIHAFFGKMKFKSGAEALTDAALAVRNSLHK